MTTAATTPTRRRHGPYFIRVMRARPRLSVSAAAGLAVIAVLFAATDWRPATRLLVGWDVGVVLYLVLALELFARCDAHHIRRRAAVQDDGRFAVLILTVAAALASLAAIFAELGTTAGVNRPPAQLGLAAATIFVSWAFIHTMFALHYAHGFYGEHAHKGGMNFPDDGPDYWDFAYFSFVIGMTFQVSDVQVTNRLIRRLVVAHGALSFVFNTAIVAVTVNLATSAI